MSILAPPAVRKSLPLTLRDLRDIAKLRESEAHRAALSRLADHLVTESSSEAAVLHAIVEAGIKAVTEEVEAKGYAQMAADLDAATRRAAARRRRPAWADE